MSKPAITTLFVLPLLLLSPSAWAIPSPDLVINLFASVGQLLGMLSLALGGAAMTLRRRSAKKVTSPWPLRITLGLLLITASGFGLYVSNQADLDNQRLRANLTRPSMEAGKQVGDVSLKTLSFSKQKEHPLGISTAELDDWINSGQQLNIIDVREPEETEAGMIIDARSVGYPDLLKDSSLIGNKNNQTLFLCFSGNRSSELCETLAAQGVDCRFMVGGYEKWLAEGRTLSSSREETGELRSLPYFPEQDLLLETPEVQTLFNEENALFVDVRYPGDFAQGHLPEAINLPLRKLTRIEAVDKLSALPKDRPIVAPCYDKRSCFYGRILGLRLHRLG